MAELTAEQALAHHDEHDEAAQNENRKFGMWLYLTSEIVIFSMLIAAYIIFRSVHVNAVDVVKESLGIVLVSGNTFVLLASSFMMVLGLRAIQRGNKQFFYLFIGLTALFGLTFLGGQYTEYSELSHLQITLEKNDLTVATTVFETVNEVEAEYSATITDPSGNVLGSSTEMVNLREFNVPPDPVVTETKDKDGKLVSTTTVEATGNYHVDFVDNAKIFKNLDISAVTSCVDSANLCIPYNSNFTLLDESGNVISDSAAIADELVKLNGNIRDTYVPLSRLAVADSNGDVVPFSAVVDGQAVDLNQTNYDNLNAYFRKILGDAVSIMGARFYAPTAFHGAHVLIGVLWALLVLWRGYRGYYDHNAIGVEMFGLYWHFVDVVWIVLFTLIYLI